MWFTGKSSKKSPPQQLPADQKINEFLRAYPSAASSCNVQNGFKIYQIAFKLEVEDKSSVQDVLLIINIPPNFPSERPGFRLQYSDEYKLTHYWVNESKEVFSDKVRVWNSSTSLAETVTHCLKGLTNYAKVKVDPIATRVVRQAYLSTITTIKTKRSRNKHNRDSNHIRIKINLLYLLRHQDHRDLVQIQTQIQVQIQL